MQWKRKHLFPFYKGVLDDLVQSSDDQNGNLGVFTWITVVWSASFTIIAALFFKLLEVIKIF